MAISISRYTYPVVSFLLSFGRLHAQEPIRQYVRQHAHPVRSIHPDSTDYTDLEPLGSAIGDARVVMLGEQDHGDAATFLAKTRLIKYLHEKKGFNVLAFESDFFALNDDHWKKTGHPETALDSLIRHYIYSLWTHCDACQQLFYRYLPATLSSAHPLELAGFDNQLLTAKPAMAALDSVMRALQLPVALTDSYAAETLPLLNQWEKNVKDSALNDRYLRCLSAIRSQLEEKLPPDDGWLLLIDNLTAMDKEYKSRGSDYWTSMNTRDAQMAANLKWLCTHRYPHEKILVWAHSYHVSKYGGHYPQTFLKSARTMGTVFTSDSSLNAMTYILGFSSYEGTSGRVFPGGRDYAIPKPSSNSFENWIPASFDYAFVDFKSFERGAADPDMPFYLAGGIMSGGTNGSFQHKDEAAPWTRIFDGIFFIRKMVPCVRVDTIPAFSTR